METLRRARLNPYCNAGIAGIAAGRHCIGVGRKICWTSAMPATAMSAASIAKLLSALRICPDPNPDTRSVRLPPILRRERVRGSFMS